MGLMGTLAKVAIGYAAARGVDKLAGGQGLGGLLGGGAQIKGQNPASGLQAQAASMMGGQRPDGAGNPLQDMMARMQGGDLSSMMGDGNPLAAMMQQMTGGGAPQGAEPARGGLLSNPGGGTGLAGLLAAAGGAAAAAQGGGMAAMLDAFNTRETAPELEEAAGLMLRAMIQAAKADGGIDEAEKAKILETLGADADAEDMAFVRAQLEAPVDVAALAADTPEAQRMQVYSASLMTIRVDTQAEAQYLDALAKAMHLDEQTVNTLHMQMGLQPLYA